MVAANKANGRKGQAADDVDDEEFADDGPLPEMTPPGSKQTSLPAAAGGPQRDEEFEAAMVAYLNAETALVDAQDAKKATYAEVKRLMRSKNCEEYRMFDANETFFLKQQDAEIKHKPTTAPDAARQTH